MIAAIILIILLVLRLLINKVENYSIRLLEINDLVIPSTKFMRLVLNEIENRYPCSHSYNLEVRYYETKNVMGRYFFNNHTIVVYISKSSKLIDVTDTLIHEYCHHLQNHSGKKERSKALELYNREYWDHPWEVQARYLASKMRLQVLKKILFIFSLGFMFASCGTTKELVYIDKNGECYPTLEYIQKMTNMSAENGVRYYWVECGWYTAEQRDSIALVENDRIIDKLIQMYDTINSKQIR